MSNNKNDIMKTLIELKKSRKELRNIVETAPAKEGVEALRSIDLINIRIRTIQLNTLIEKYTLKLKNCRNLNEFNKYANTLNKYEQELKNL